MGCYNEKGFYHINLVGTYFGWRRSRTALLILSLGARPATLPMTIFTRTGAG
jgi:hypothetical protein